MSARQTESPRQQRPVLRRLRPTVLRWTPKTLYGSLLHLFGEQVHERVRPVAPPFNPPLNARELKIARDMYTSARLAMWVARLRRRPRGDPPGHAWKSWPDRDGVFDEVEVAFWRLHFADSKRTQKAARAEVKRLSASGSIETRRALSAARKATPQAKRAISMDELLRLFLPRAAQLEFAWALLRGEAKSYGDWSPAQLGDTAAALAKAYACLDLPAVQIKKGLLDNDPVSTQLAAEFGIKPSTVRSLFPR